MSKSEELEKRAYPQRQRSMPKSEELEKGIPAETKKYAQKRRIEKRAYPQRQKGTVSSPVVMGTVYFQAYKYWI